MAGEINNYDSVTFTPSGFGIGMQSGRWFLSILGLIVIKISGSYNSPYLNCLIAIFFLALSNVFLIQVFKIKNKWVCFLLSAITVTFPSIGDTMFFSFTVHYYMLAVLLGVTGVFVIQKVSLAKKRAYKAFLILSASMMYACSLGIYQAYYPYIAVLLVVSLIGNCLDENENWKNIIVNSIYYLASLGIGYVLYMVILKVCLFLHNSQLSNYYGIDKIGSMDLKQLPGLVYKAYVSYILLYRQDYVALNMNFLVRAVILLIDLFILVSVLYIWRKNNILKMIELCVFLLLLPLASNAIYIMVANETVRTMMAMGTISIFYLPLIFFDKIDYGKNVIVKHVNNVFFVSVMLVTVLNYVWANNVNYRALYYQNRRVENYYVTMYSRITSVSGYNENMPVIFIGKNINDSSFVENWTEMSYYGWNIYGQINAYSRNKFMENYLGHSYLEITEEQYLQYQDEISQMNTYPNDTSIKVIDGKAGIK